MKDLFSDLYPDELNSSESDTPRTNDIDDDPETQQEWLFGLSSESDEGVHDTLTKRSEHIDVEIITPAAVGVTDSDDGAATDLKKASDVWEYSEKTELSWLNCERFIINEWSQSNLSESEFCEIAAREGIVPERMPFDSLGILSGCFGIDTTVCFDMSSDALCEAVRGGARVIASVNHLLLEGNENSAFFGTDRAVEVLAVNHSPNGEQTVILNHPCIRDGAMAAYPFEVFIQAWRAGSCAAIVAYPPKE